MLYYLLITSLSLLLFWFTYKGLLQSDTLFSRNRLYLLATSFIALALPFVDLSGLINRFFIPQETLPQTLPLPYYTTTISVEAQHKAAAWEVDEILLFVWLAGAGLLMLQSAFQVGRLYQFVQAQSRHQNLATPIPALSAAIQDITLIPTQGKLPTSSFGKWLFWDNTQPLAAHELESILLHEYAHIRQGHTWDVLYMELFRALLWFHPVAWLYVRELRAQHEYLADAAATRNTAPQAYIRLMAMATLQSNHLQPIHTFFSVSSVKKRIVMLTKPKTSLLRGHLKTVAALSIVAAVGITAACTNSLDRLMRDQQVAEANKYEKIAPASTDSGADEIFTVVEKPAEYEGGIAELLKVISKNLRYPAEARREGVQGKVFVQFVIDEQGNLISPEVVKGVSPELDAEALRVIQLSGKWTPGEQRGRKVKQRIVLPISFVLGTGNPTTISVGENQPSFGAVMSQMPHPIPADFNGLILIDGKESSMEELKALPVGSVKRIQVTKSTEQLAGYGAKGKNDVLEITTGSTPIVRNQVAQIKVDPNDIMYEASGNGLTVPGKRFDKLAEPQGGMQNFMTYIGKNLKYPAEARRAGVEGTVYVAFVVDEQGNLTNPKVRKGLSPELDAEALRLIQNSERWNPAESEGKKVKQSIILPISFKLGAAE
ncbi:TonB family protein [Rhodoflexus sp.]